MYGHTLTAFLSIEKAVCTYVGRSRQGTCLCMISQGSYLLALDVVSGKIKLMSPMIRKRTFAGKLGPGGICHMITSSFVCDSGVFKSNCSQLFDRSENRTPSSKCIWFAFVIWMRIIAYQSMFHSSFLVAYLVLQWERQMKRSSPVKSQSILLTFH